MTEVMYRNRSVKLTIDQQDAFDYLLSLRDSGITNMFGAAPYLEGAFDIEKDEAGYWLQAWMKSFK